MPAAMPRYFRIGLILAAAVAGTALGLLAFEIFSPAVPQRQVQQATARPPAAAFELLDHTGRAVTQTDFDGRAMMIFFGFTNCPDVCPTALSTAGEILDALGPDADRLTAVFVTVDPERDTVDRMAEYVAAFHPRIVGLTGTVDQVRRATEAYGIFFRKVPQQDGYSMDHTAVTLLVDPAGRLAGTLDPHESFDVMLGKARRLAGRAQPAS